MSDSDYSNQDLSGRDFSNAILERVNLRGANLTGAIFKGAVLTDANLQESCLRDADFTDVRGLMACQLRGCDVTGAKLPPDISKFEALGVAAEASKNGSAIFLSLLIACAYTWVTIASTTDAGLLTNTALTQLPIIQASIPLPTFYVCAPLLLFAIFLYFHFSLQILWESLASLPGRFTDGRPLHERVYPWLLNVIARPQFISTSQKQLAFPRLQAALVRLFAWWILPITLLFFWWAGLKRQDPALTGLHLALFFSAVISVRALMGYATDTLRGISPSSESFSESILHRDAWRPILNAAVPTLLLSALSASAFYGSPQGWVPSVFESFGVSRHANLVKLSLSARPTDWNGTDIERVAGVDLRWRRLRHADLSLAFIVNGVLDRADLTGTHLVGADLRGAHMERTNLRGADLKYADLRGAHLWYAELTNANLGRANLQDVHWRSAKSKEPCDVQEFGQMSAQQVQESTNWVLSHMNSPESLGLPQDHNLRQQLKDFSGYDFANLKLKVVLYKSDLRGFDLTRTNLSNIDLTHAHLERANLHGANLTGAKLWDCDLRGADLTDAIGLTDDQLKEALTDDKTRLQRMSAPLKTNKASGTDRLLK